jgi:glutathione synthase/RimK-type ligase-like ATP-grasp enzyme
LLGSYKNILVIKYYTRYLRELTNKYKRTQRVQKYIKYIKEWMYRYKQITGVGGHIYDNNKKGFKSQINLT